MKRLNKKKNIKDFYLRDENSVLSPGASDFITRKKIKERKCFLSDSVGSLYKKYCKEYRNEPDLLVCRTLFFKLKPFWVLKPKA